MFSRYVYLLRLAIFIAPVVFILAVTLYKLNYGIVHWYYERWFYERLTREDGLLEYGTTAAYLVAIPIAYAVAQNLLKSGRKLMGVLYLLLAIAYFFVGMEEISWGQRIFDIKVPESIIEKNRQDELNIHNLKGVNKFLPTAYVAIGLLGGLSWMLALLFSRKTTSPTISKFVEIIETQTPHWYLMTYFLPVAIFYILLLVAFSIPNAVINSRIFFGFLHSRDQEPAEFFLALGFLFFTLDVYLRQAQEKAH